MKIEILPEGAQKVVDQFHNLQISETCSIVTPYHINYRKQRAGLRVMIGKGSPEEIIQETKIYAKLKGMNLKTANSEEIRDFMFKVGIGIECSGFVVYVLEGWLRSQGKKHLWNYIKFPKLSLTRKMIKILRPIENISANVLTGPLNTEIVDNLDDIQVGDLIRLHGLKRGFHIALISKVTRNNDGVIQDVEYVNSTRWYEDKHGIRFGKIEIIDPDGELKDQKFIDEYNSRNYFYEELMVDYEDSGIRRLKNVPLS